MLKRIYFTLLFFSFTLPLLASEYTYPADSIRVKWMNGKKYVLHKVEPMETWTSIGKLYNCTVQYLKEVNAGVKDLKIGQIIHVPTDYQPAPSDQGNVNSPTPPAAVPAKETKTPSNTSVSQDDQKVMHTVLKGETLYSIAKRYHLTLTEIKAMNNLTQDVVNEGQQLIVGKKSQGTTKPDPTPSEAPAPVKEPVKSPPGNQRTASENPMVVPENTTASTSKTVIPAMTINQSNPAAPGSSLEKPTKSVSPVKKNGTGKTLMQVTETGVASWIQENQLNQNKYYALHRNAPIGTIIKVTNRMNNQFVYVKVVGVLPNTGENENVILKVSQAVTSKLNALDPLFQVELSYGLMQ